MVSNKRTVKRDTRHIVLGQGSTSSIHADMTKATMPKERVLLKARKDSAEGIGEEGTRARAGKAEGEIETAGERKSKLRKERRFTTVAENTKPGSPG